MKNKIRAILLLALCVVSFSFGAKPFAPGERVVFLGDSITHYGKWWPNIWCGYAAQFPDHPPLFFSAGFSGDTATGALRRLDRDVFSRNPDTVCVMFGMNDVRRNTYTAENSAADQAAQKAALETYRESMDQLLKRITDKGVRCIVVTPSPYDQTMVHPEAGALNPGCNDGLAIASRIATELAQKHNCEVVDFHGPMTRINAGKQAQDPSLTIIGMDRIHPGDEGAEIMATLFLEAQGLDPAGVESAERFEAVWMHVDLERHLRNIVWLEDRVLRPNGIDPSDIEAARTFIREDFEQTRGGDRLRVASFLEWRGNEEKLLREIELVEDRLRKADVCAAE